jgi:hypothetical protein
MFGALETAEKAYRSGIICWVFMNNRSGSACEAQSHPHFFVSLLHNSASKALCRWERSNTGVEDMLRKTIVALFAVVSIGLLSPSVALARGGFGGFHGGGGGFHGGFGGFHGGGFHGGGFRIFAASAIEQMVQTVNTQNVLSICFCRHMVGLRT